MELVGASSTEWQLITLRGGLARPPPPGSLRVNSPQYVYDVMYVTSLLEVQGVLAIRDPRNFMTTYFQTVILLIHRNFVILMWKKLLCYSTICDPRELEQKISTFNLHSSI